MDKHSARSYYSQQRKLELLRNFLDILREYGDEARYTSRARMYEKAAQRSNFSPNTARTYLTQMAKDGTEITELDKEDLELFKRNS